MKLLINKKGQVQCPKYNRYVFEKDCLVCEYLGIHNGDNIACRWSKEKELLKTGEAKYADFAER